MKKLVTFGEFPVTPIYTLEEPLRRLFFLHEPYPEKSPVHIHSKRPTTPRTVSIVSMDENKEPQHPSFRIEELEVKIAREKMRPADYGELLGLFKQHWGIVKRIGWLGILPSKEDIESGIHFIVRVPPHRYYLRRGRPGGEIREEDKEEMPAQIIITPQDGNLHFSPYNPYSIMTGKQPWYAVVKE